MYGKIHSIETFGTVDGPGIRYVIFMQGCPMRCGYCHNPDSWDMNAGNYMSIDDLVTDISKYLRYIDGITVSGGEPLLQIDFLIKLFRKVKSLGITTCIDTSGTVFDKDDKSLLSKIDELLDFTDLVLLDIKHIDNDAHKLLTGKENINILDFAKYLEKKDIPTWLRYVLVPTINDDDKTMLMWKKFANSLGNIRNIEVLPYHRLGIEKYNKLGIPYRFKDIPEPTKELVAHANIILKQEKGE